MSSLVSFLEEDRESFLKFLSEHRFRHVFSQSKYDLYIRYLKDPRQKPIGMDEQELKGKARNAANTKKNWILRNYYLNGENLMTKEKKKRVVVSNDIYKVITSEHKLHHRVHNLFDWQIFPMYHGIPRKAVRYLVKLCRKCHPPYSDRGQPEVQTTSRQTPTISSNSVDELNGVDSESQENSVDDVLEWLQKMNDRDWQGPLECSRYRDIISGLYEIFKKAKPANAHIPGETQSASYDVLYLTMDEAKVRKHNETYNHQRRHHNN